MPIVCRPCVPAADLIVEPYLLPYPPSALQPHLSTQMVGAHLAHHQQLQQQLIQRIAGTDLATMELEVVVAASRGTTFELAAECWNHAFFWQCLDGRGGGEPGGRIGERIARDFGGFAQLQAEFSRQAALLPGEGWVWLVEHADGRLAVTGSVRAGTPITGSSRPLLACDLWQHAIPRDAEGATVDWLPLFWRLVNWNAVEQNLR